MNICLYELEQRLKDLENEQDRQNRLLQEEVNRLELELAQNKVNQGRPKIQGTISQEVSHSKKTKAPAAKLAPVNNADIANLKQNPEKMVAKPTVHVKSNRRTGVVACEYVIRLTLNAKLPLEWSGTGWTKCGQGRHYPSVELAQKSVRQLAKHWPADCLKIIERQVSEYPSL